MNGPAIIIDKSFVHRLKASHLFELQVFFTIVPTPILKREILSNLAKPSNDETDWVSVARSLCRKLSTSHVDLIYYRTAALSELLTGDFVPMNGVPILNADAPHVSFQNGGIFRPRINRHSSCNWPWRTLALTMIKRPGLKHVLLEAEPRQFEIFRHTPPP